MRFLKIEHDENVGACSVYDVEDEWECPKPAEWDTLVDDDEWGGGIPLQFCTDHLIERLIGYSEPLVHPDYEEHDG